MFKIRHIFLFSVVFILQYTVKCQDDEMPEGDDEQQLGLGKSGLTGTTGIIRGVISDLLRRKGSTTPSSGHHQNLPISLPNIADLIHRPTFPNIHPATHKPPVTKKPVNPDDPDKKPSPDPVYPGGNLLIQFTNVAIQKTVYYLQLFSDPWTKQFDLTNVERDQQEIKNVRITRGPPPAKVSGQFSSAGHAEFTISLPKTTANGNFKAKSGTSGAFSSEIDDLTAVVQIAVSYGDSKAPKFYVKNCATTATKFSSVFRDASLAGSTLDDLRKFTETNIAQGYKDFVCHGAKYLSIAFNGVFFDMQHPIYASLPTYPEAPTQSVNMSLLCGPENVFTPPAKAENLYQDILDEINGLSLDMTMNSPNAYISNKEMIIGLRGDFEVRNTGSGLGVPQARPMWTSYDRSMCFIVNETIVKSFVYHAFREHYFDNTVEFLRTDVPNEIWPQITAYCPGTCRVFANVSAIKPSTIDFRKAVPHSITKLRVNIFSQSGDRVERVLDGQIDIDVNSIIYYEANALKSYPAQLGGSKIQLDYVYLPDLLDKQASLMTLINNLYVLRLWPKLDAKYKKMLQKRGIRLPGWCGVILVDPVFTYGDGHVYFCTNFVYQYDQMMVRYNAWCKERGLI